MRESKTDTMSYWNDIMQSLHSSLIDELNERYPDDKLELGLPKRFSGWTLLPDATQAVHLPIELGTATGVCILAGGAGQSSADLTAILSSAVNRAEKEFARRNVAPKFLPPLVAPRPERPQALPSPALLIFFPIRIRADEPNALIFDFAVGV